MYPSELSQSRPAAKVGTKIMRLNNRSLAYISPSTESGVYVTIKSETYFPTLTFFWEFLHIIRVPCGYQTSDNRSVSLIWTLKHNFYAVYLLLSVKTQHYHVLGKAQHQEDDAKKAPSAPITSLDPKAPSAPTAQSAPIAKTPKTPKLLKLLKLQKFLKPIKPLNPLKHLKPLTHSDQKCSKVIKSVQ